MRAGSREQPGSRDQGDVHSTPFVMIFAIRLRLCRRAAPTLGHRTPGRLQIVTKIETPLDLPCEAVTHGPRLMEFSAEDDCRPYDLRRALRRIRRPPRRFDDLFEGAARCGICGQRLHTIWVEARRSYRCDGRHPYESVPIKPIPMDWCERAILSKLLEVLRYSNSSLSASTNNLLELHAASILRRLEERQDAGPLKRSSAGDLIDAVRCILRLFELQFESDGLVRLDLDINWNLLPAWSRDAWPSGGAKRSIYLDLEAIATRERTRAEHPDAAAITAAKDGIYDLPDEVWRNIASTFARVDPGTNGDLASARLFFDGFLCMIGTGASWAHLPTRFGDRLEFDLAWKRIVWEGVWDDVVHILNRHFPGVLDERHINRLASASFPRKPDAQPRRLSESGMGNIKKHLASPDDLVEKHPKVGVF